MDKMQAHIRANEYIRAWFTNAKGDYVFDGIEARDIEQLIEYVLTGDKKLIELPEYEYGN